MPTFIALRTTRWCNADWYVRRLACASRARPASLTLALCARFLVLQALYHGVHAFLLKFDDRDSEQAFGDASQLLMSKGYVRKGDPLVVVRGGTEPIWRPKSPYACQIRMVE